MSKLIAYIAAAIRYATQETGLKDWSGFIILVNEYTEAKEEMLGMPVYILPMRASAEWSFTLACPWDISTQKEKALISVLEYQEMYPMELIE